MKLFVFIVPMLVTLAAASAFDAASALATSNNNPGNGWCKEGSGVGLKFTTDECNEESKAGKFERLGLGPGENEPIGVEGNGAQALGVSSAVLEAKKLTAATGATLIGSSAPNPGMNEEALIYEEVSVKGSPNCKIEQNEKVVTRLETSVLTGTLVYIKKAAAEKEEVKGTGTLLQPKSGKSFIKFKLRGAECPVTGEFNVEGSTVLENIVTAEKEQWSQLAPTQELNGPASAIKVYYVNESGKTVEKAGGLKASEASVSDVGKVKITDKAKHFWGVTTT